MSHAVFISYATNYKAVADALCLNLETAGIPCWIAPRDIAPGEDWPTAITLAIARSRLMVLVFSASVNASEDISRALSIAAVQGVGVIYFKIENVPPQSEKQYHLTYTHWMEASNPPTPEQIQALVDYVMQLLTLHAGPPEPNLSRQPERTASQPRVLQTSPIRKVRSVDKPMPPIPPAKKKSGGLVPGGSLLRRLEQPESPVAEELQLKKEKYNLSLAYPKLLSKRHESLFLVQIYLPEMRSKVSQAIARKFEQKPVEHDEESDLEIGQTVTVKISSPGITFSDPVVMKLDKPINATHFLATPNDSCQEGLHQVLLSVTDAGTQIEYFSNMYAVKISDFAFDHISQPLLSKAFSIIIGAGSLIMFILTLLGQIDTTFGLASGTASGLLASGIFWRFFSLYQQPKFQKVA